MTSILLLIQHQQNRYLLSQWLTGQYRVLSPNNEDDFATQGKQLLAESFDLCFIDYGAIALLRPQMLARREAVVPIFLPFVFLTSRQNIGFSSDHLEPLIDDIISIPIGKIELKTKLRVLLRSRSYSLQLKTAKEELSQSLLQEQELNRLKSIFVSTVSHEFRNPLNSISGMAQILETYGDKLTPEKKSEILLQLKRNVTKMTDLIDDLLVISRKDLGKLELDPAPIDLEKFGRDIVNEIQTAFDRNLAIDFVYQGDREKYSLDRKLLHHATINILSNACKYSPQDATIDFKIQGLPQQIVFTIRDRGIGIPREDIAHLFDSFYRASNSRGYQGTGLGLAIAKQYVELHRGRIAVASELEVGTSFIVTIPLEI